MDLWSPQAIADYFDVDVLQDSEEFFHKQDEEVDEHGKWMKKN